MKEYHKMNKMAFILIIVILSSCTNNMSKAEQYILENNYEKLNNFISNNSFTETEIGLLFKKALSYSAENNAQSLQLNEIKIISLLNNVCSDPSKVIKESELSEDDLKKIINKTSQIVPSNSNDEDQNQVIDLKISFISLLISFLNEPAELNNWNNFNTAEINLLLSKIISSNYQNGSKVESSIIELLAILIGSSDNPNIILEDGTGLIFWALDLEDKILFQQLINHSDIDLNLIDKKNNRLVRLFFKNINDELFDFLLDKGLSICSDNFETLSGSEHPLYSVLYKLKYDKVIKIIDHLEIENINKLQWSPMTAIFHRYMNQKLQNQEGLNRKLYFKLKSLGVELDYESEDGMTLLHSAVETGDLVIIKDLLEAGVDVNAKFKNEYTAFFYAVMQFGGGPGKTADPILVDIENIFNEYGYIHIDY